MVSFDAKDRRQVFREAVADVQKAYPDHRLQVTMDTYVHVTDDSKLLAVRQFEGRNLNTNGKNGVNGVRTSEKMV